MNNTIKINKFALVCIVLLFALIIGKIFFVSLSKNIDGIDMQKFALSRTTEKKTLYASRGSIYDKNGEALAQNVNSYTVIAYLSEKRTTNKEKPQHVVDIDYTISKLSPLLGMDETRMRKLLERDAYQVELGPEGRGITELLKGKIEELKLPGIDFVKEAKRYYPYGNFASYTIGYAKEQDDGALLGEMGIESFYNDEISGTDGYIEYQKDAYGYKIANTPYREIKAESGHNIYLTIDSNVQMYLENAINDFINNYETDWVTITVADAKTGAIVGTASNPNFDLNKLNITNYNNPLVAYNYEPGSTMKIFSFMSSMEEGKYKGNDTYQSGTITVDDYTIKDWNKIGWGSITYDTGFTYSSNVAATLLAQQVGKEKLKDYYTALGFGKKTGVELFGELEGKVNFLYNSELAAASYGQGITITPIQMIQALTTLTNNGVIMKPYIVDKITDDEGKILYTGNKTEGDKVFSTETINKMVELMDLTVNGEDNAATGKVYSTDLVRLIGKTGTAQYISDTGDYNVGGTKNIRSFAGIFPKDDPEYIIYVSVKDLNGSSNAMGSITKSVVESIVKYKNLDERESNLDNSKYVKLSSYINKDVNETKSQLEMLGLTPIIIGDGDKIVSQFPQKNQTIIINSKVYLLTNTTKINMINIVGWNKTEVINLMNFMNIDYEINGTGLVTNYNIPDNNEITEKVIINLESNEVKNEEKEP